MRHVFASLVLPDSIPGNCYGEDVNDHAPFNARTVGRRPGGPGLLMLADLDLPARHAEAAAAEGPPGGVAWPVHAGVVPPAAGVFTLRPDSVPGIEAVLDPGAAVALVSGGQAGRPSCAWSQSRGKTQLAAWLARCLWRSGDVDLLVWVNAASRASVLSGYTEAAAQLGLDHGGTAESVAARLAAWLGSTGRQWLVVLDDLRDAVDLEGLWPSGPAGRVLVTAAGSEVVPRGLAAAVPVPAFDMREAMEYLFGRLAEDRDQRNGAYSLAEALGAEPLALGQAAAVAAWPGAGCRSYQARFARERSRLRAAAGAEAPAAAVTWLLSADYAQQLLPGGGTQALLVLASLLDSHGIPPAVLTAPAARRYLAGTGTGHVPDPGRAWKAVLALERAGLVSAGLGGGTAVWVSGPVQAAVRAAVPAQLLEQAALAAADALLEAWPDDEPAPGQAAMLRSCAASLLEHAGDVLVAGGSCHRVLLRAGQSMTAARLSGPAAAWLRVVTGRCEPLLGADHACTLEAAGQLADALLAAGQAADAVRWARWVLDARERVHGPGHPGTAAASLRLGRALAGAGEADQALTVLHAAAGRTGQAGSPGSLELLDGYAAGFLAAGDTGAAVRFGKQSLAACERQHGPAAPATLAAALRLAGAFTADGRPRAAVSQYKRVAAARGQVLGPCHPDTLAARAALAGGHDAAGQIGAALREHQQACAGSEELLGPDHPQTLARRAGLAGAYCTAGQLSEAVPLLRDSLARAGRALPPGDPVTRALQQLLDGVTTDPFPAPHGVPGKGAW